MTALNAQISYFTADGRPTIEGQKAFRDMDAALTSVLARMAVLEAKLAAIGAVGYPSGGGTVDSEARAAVAAVIASAS